MVDFIYNLFKSKEVKTNEEYEKYKSKYREKIKILKQGNLYAIEDSLSFRRNLKFRTPFYYTLEDTKRIYVEICESVEKSKLPITEI